MLQNDPFDVEEENEHDFTRGKFHKKSRKPQLSSLHRLHRFDG
jgi:hypothetical protein